MNSLYQILRQRPAYAHQAVDNHVDAVFAQGSDRYGVCFQAQRFITLHPALLSAIGHDGLGGNRLDFEQQLLDQTGA